jgi:transcriptional regulator
MASPPDLLPGTLDLLILRTLQKDALHGWAISERIQHISEDVLQIYQGSLYPALHRLEHRGWIEAEWAVSELGRRAKYYRLTAAGRKQLAVETREWERMSHAIAWRSWRNVMNLRDVLCVFAPWAPPSYRAESRRFHLEREAQAPRGGPDPRAKPALARSPMPLAADQCRDARGTSLVDTDARRPLCSARLPRAAAPHDRRDRHSASVSSR